MERGILKIRSLEKFTMTFISDNSKKSTHFQSSREDFRKWFFNATLEQAVKGVPASYDGGTKLMTDGWDLLRRAQFMSGSDFQLSKAFC